MKNIYPTRLPTKRTLVQQAAQCAHHLQHQHTPQSNPKLMHTPSKHSRPLTTLTTRPYLVEQLHDHIGALVDRALTKLKTGRRNAQIRFDRERLHGQRDGLLGVGALWRRVADVQIQRIKGRTK